MFSTKLNGSVVPVKNLTGQDLARMFDLMNENYEGMKKDNFDNDIAEKRDVIMLRESEGNQIQGFSTITVLEEKVRGEPTKVLFSGDTIIDKQYWGSSELEKQFINYSFSLIDESPQVPLFWFLMSKGYKTYRFLPVFFHEFYPRHDTSTPNYEQEVLDTFAGKKFPLNYNPQTGLIVFNGAKDKLRKGVADVEEPRLKNPHINYFVQRNPRWADGEELACIVRLTKDNFNSMAHRIVGK